MQALPPLQIQALWTQRMHRRHPLWILRLSLCRLRSPSDQQRQQCQRQQHQQPQQRQLLPCTQAKFLQLPLSDG